MKKSINELLAALREMTPSELKTLSISIQETFSVNVGEPEKKPYYDFWQFYYLGSGYDIFLNEVSLRCKRSVIKELHTLKNISLLEAKKLIEYHLPVKIAEGCSEKEASEIRDLFETLGAVVSIEHEYIYDPLPDGLSHD